MDRSSQLVLSALTRAAADATGVPLHGTRTTPGLFPTTTLGKQAAQRCRDEGYLSAHAADRGGDQSVATIPHCTITDKGLAHLLDQLSPREVLEDFVRVLEARESQVTQLLANVRQMHASLEALRGTVTKVLNQVNPATSHLNALCLEFRKEAPAPSTNGSGDGPATTTRISHVLSEWRRSGAPDDCPIPELYHRVECGSSTLSIGAFHDALRQLHHADRVYLHPWTGPLYAIPEPRFALLVGHEIAYYASERPVGVGMQTAE